MKVKELIEVLSRYDPELRVVCNHGNGGYNDLGNHQEITICVDYHYDESKYMGLHEYESFLTEHWNGQKDQALWLG
jgi:hypothetical protein